MDNIRRGLGVALVCAALCAPSALYAADVLTVGTGSSAPGGSVQVPVYVLDNSGTPLGSGAGTGNKIQGFGFKISYSPAASVSSITFARAGVLAALTPLYEKTVTTSSSIAYVGSFSETTNPVPFAASSAPGDQIGTLTVNVAPGASTGSSITLTIDSTTAILSNQAGTTVETVAATTLSLVNGSVALPGGTTVALTSSLNPSVSGGNVSFTATVTPSSATGTVTFKDGTSTLGSVSLSSGSAVYTTSSLTVGTHSITAVYGGDSQNNSSTSSAVSQVVKSVTLSTPTGFSATATSTPTVTLSWSAVSGATGYEVRRRSGGSYTLVGSPTGTSMSDVGVVANTTYLYIVRAVNGSGGVSGDSVVDAATTIQFTDDPLVALSTNVKLVHLTQLRTAVNAFRTAAGLSSFSFTDASPTTIKAIHLQELRTAFDAARLQAGVTAMSYTDPTITAQSTKIKKAHFQEIRDAMK